MDGVTHVLQAPSWHMHVNTYARAHTPHTCIHNTHNMHAHSTHMYTYNIHTHTPLIRTNNICTHTHTMHTTYTHHTCTHTTHTYAHTQHTHPHTSTPTPTHTHTHTHTHPHTHTHTHTHTQHTHTHTHTHAHNTHVHTNLACLVSVGVCRSMTRVWYYSNLFGMQCVPCDQRCPLSSAAVCPSLVSMVTTTTPSRCG